MKMLMILQVLSITAIFADMVSYNNYVVFRLSVNGSNPKEVNMYRHLRDNDFLHSTNFWNDYDIMVAPDSIPTIKKNLNEAGISFNVMIENVQVLLDAESERLSTAKEVVYGRDPDPSFFNDYRSNDEHIKFMADIVSTYSSIAKSVTIGSTYLKNTIHGVTVTSAKNNNSAADKPGIFYECGIHSREWVAHSTCAYMMHQLASQYGKDDRITKLVDEIEWTFVPVLNVDGYLYTWSNDRMWRKTRKPNSGSSCVGTDPNRNWDSHWCEQGASTNPCSDSYCGSAAFTEHCVSASAQYVKAHSNIVGFIDFHSYSQLWMRPYGYSGSEPADYLSQQALGRAAIANIKSTHGKTYEEGSIYKIIYPASGSSCDYIYDTLERKWPFGVELRDTGQYGFILPASNIVPTGQEILSAALGMGEYILANV